jgi:Sugar-specific transcriptional regulator TrmB
MDEKFFRQLGLSTSHFNIYKCLLVNGDTTIKLIVDTTGESRTNTYMALDKLVKLGLAEPTSDKKASFSPCSPQKIKQMIDSQARCSALLSKEFGAILPSLQSSFALTTKKPGVVIFEGVDGLAKVYADILATGEDLTIFPCKNARKDPKLDKLITESITKQCNKGIKSRGIYPDELYEASDMAEISKSNISVRFIGPFRHDAQIIIYKDSVATTVFGDSIITTLINSKEMASTLRGVFDTLWEVGREKLA